MKHSGYQFKTGYRVINLIGLDGFPNGIVINIYNLFSNCDNLTLTQHI